MRKIYPLDFMVYIFFRTFKSYIYAVSFFSLTLTISIAAAAKYLIKEIQPGLLENEQLQILFHFSIFFFIPIFMALLLLKFKKKFIEQDSYRELSMPRIVAIFFTCLIMILLCILFAFLLMK